MRKFSLVAAAAAALAGPAAAQQAPQAPSPEQIEAALQTFRVIGGAMQTEQVPKGMKDALFRCLYGNSLSTISEQVTTVIEANEELSADDNLDVLRVTGAVCGFRPEPAPAE